MEILSTVAEPEELYLSPPSRRPQIAAVKRFTKLKAYGLADNLVVHYREVSKTDGFILTAYVMSNEKLRKRFRKWRKLS